MTIADLKAHYGTILKASAALGIHRITIYNWGVKGRIPKDVQGYIHYMTRGALKPDFDAPQ